MFGFGKKERTEVGPVAGFGKIPAMGDFVRTPKSSDEAHAFETWLARALESGEARGGQAFRQRFEAGATHAFLWSGTIKDKTRGLLAGVMMPSRDAVGRRFPVVVCAPLPPAAFAAAPHAAPLLLHEFFHHAADAAARASRTRAPSEFHAQVVSVRPPSLDGAGELLARYGTWSQARAADRWRELWGDGAAHASAYALYMVVEATAAYRGHDTPPLSLGVRVPLGADVRTGVAMWIDVARSAAGWKTTVPSVFFPLGVPGARALVQLGAEPPTSVIADLFLDGQASEATCDVATTAGTKLPAALPESVGRALANADASVADVVRELGK